MNVKNVSHAGGVRLSADAVVASLQLLETLGAEIVDRCPQPDCAACRPWLGVAA